MKKLILLFSGFLFAGILQAQSYSGQNAGEPSDAITQQSLDTKELSVYVDGEYLYLRGFDTSTSQTVMIYNLTGKLLITVNQSLELPINISSIGRGIYFMKTGNTSLKFVKR